MRHQRLLLVARRGADQLLLRALGDLGADVTIALTRQFLVSNAGRLDPAGTEVIAAYLEGRERELERLRRSIGTPWRGVDGVSFRRLLGRAVSGL